jgi:voltage-gated potassium channel
MEGAMKISEMRGRPISSRLRGLYADLKRENLPRIIFGISVLLAAGALSVYLAESNANHGMFSRPFDALWWAVVTWSTVGYGDKYPITAAGKIFSIALIFASVAATAILSGTIASIFVDRKIREGKGLREITLKNHVVICGWNPNLEKILSGLARMSGGTRIKVVLVNEMDPEAFQDLAARFKTIDLRFVRGDFTRESSIRRASLKNARTAVIVSDVSGPNTLDKADERTILGTLAVKSLNPRIVTSAELVNSENESHLKRANVDDIIVNGEFNGFLLASSTAASGIPQLVKEILSFDGKNVVKQKEIPPGFVGRRFSELSEHFIATGAGILIGIRSEEKKISLDDILAGDSSAIDDFIKRKFAEAEMDYLEGDGKAENIRINPGPDYAIGEADKAFLIGQPE